MLAFWQGVFHRDDRSFSPDEAAFGSDYPLFSRLMRSLLRWQDHAGGDRLKLYKNNNQPGSIMNTSTILGVALATVLMSASGVAVELPDPESVRTDRLQLMEGFPPAADKQITQAGFMRPYPNPRWSFHHARELFPSRRVARGNEGVYELPRAEGREQQITDLTFAAPDGRQATVQQVLNMTADIDYTEVYADRDSDVVKYSLAAGMAPIPHDYAGARDLYSYLPTIGKRPVIPS